MDESATTQNSSNWEDHEDWEHYDSHRERRDLYKSLEGMMYVSSRWICPSLVF